MLQVNTMQEARHFLNHIMVDEGKTKLIKCIMDEVEKRAHFNERISVHGLISEMWRRERFNHHVTAAMLEVLSGSRIIEDSDRIFKCRGSWE